MSHQFRLVNWNEDGSPSRDRDARALRYLMASNSSSSIAFNNRTGSVGTRDQTVTDNINATHMPSSMYPSIAQLGATPSNYHQLQTIVGNNNNNNDSSTSFNTGRNNNAAVYATGNAIVTSTDTRNASFKRSRSPDFTRGESSNQGSRVGGTLRRRTNPPTATFQPESVNNNNRSSLSSTPISTLYSYNGNSVFSNMLQPQIHNQHPTHAGPIGFFDDTPSYNSPSIIDEDAARFFFPSQQETPRASLTVPLRTEPMYASTSAASLYPSAMRGGTTQAAASTSLFQRNNNFFSFEAGSSSSSQSPGGGFYGRANVFLAPSIVHVQSNSYAPRQPQLPSDPSTSSYSQNHPPPPPGPGFSTVVESDQYMHTGLSLVRSRNRRGGGNTVLTSTSPELRAQRNRLRNQVFSALQHLLNGGSIRAEDSQIIDYSIVLDILDSQECINMLHNIEDWPYEVISAIGEDIRRLETGLTEEEILTYIEIKFHVSNPNETSTQNKTCTICQEDYVEGEIIGRLDCRHIYHLECIKQWLLLKNECPICKQIALEVDEDED